MATGRDLTETPGFLLLLAASLMARPFAETIGNQHDLTHTEWRTMMVLASRPGLANVDIAEACGIDVMTASRAVRRLERRALIERHHDHSDRRRVVAKLTQNGLQLYRTVGSSAERRLELLFSDLNSHEREQLSRHLRTVIAKLRRVPVDPGAQPA